MRAALSPREYRAFAAQCSRWAARAKREEHKKMMLRMADHWIQTAQELERAGMYRCAPSGACDALEPLQNDTRHRQISSKNLCG
jgi:hypothetical protein